MSSAEVLVVDDEPTIREGLESVLVGAGYRVRAVEGIAAARRAIAQSRPRCVLLDVRLKDGDGLAFLAELRERDPSLRVIMATAFGDAERTIAAMKRGAFEYVTKPFDLDALLDAVARAVDAPAIAQAAPAAVDDDGAAMIGSSAAMLDVWKAIGRAANSDVPVLVTGESGVGKELVAQAIHRHSDRAARPFVAVNIAALPPTLVESELFGHEKGAFTGAAARREGRFEAAGDGTLFLDEIGDLDVGLQTKLLRVLQEGTFERVGSQSSIASRARIVAATSKPVRPGEPGATLREDLFYRLGVVTIRVPALRERRSDVPLLVHAFLARMKGPRRAVSEAAMAQLSSREWPGNVRELRHVLERACVMSSADVIDAGDLRDDAAPAEATEHASTDDLDLKRATSALHRTLIERAIARADGNRAEAARLLGVARPQLYAMMKDLGVTPADKPKR
jgi:DNA-binding NtrC family response regulator